MAEASGVTTKSIRFYERAGLLPLPPRTGAGYRAYNENDVERLQFIRKAKHLGLTLEEIKGVLQVHDQIGPPCVRVRSLLQEKLAQVDRAIADFQEFRADLVHLNESVEGITDCRPNGGRICGIVEQSRDMHGESVMMWLNGRRRAAGSRK